MLGPVLRLWACSTAQCCEERGGGGVGEVGGGWRGDSSEASHPGSLGGTGEGAPAQQERIMVTSAFKVQRASCHHHCLLSLSPLWEAVLLRDHGLAVWMSFGS